MDGYPDSEEEFELMYGDELDAFRENDGREIFEKMKGYVY